MTTPADHDKRCPAAWDTSVKCNCGAQAADEIALIEKTLKSVGITSLLNHGAASCVFTEGCCGVSQEHILAYTRKIALYCAVALSAPPAAQAVGWISVDERLPEPDVPVLAHNGKWTGVAAWMSGEYLEPLERWQDEHREFIEMMGPAITHWMPLPAALGPADGESNG